MKSHILQEIPLSCKTHLDQKRKTNILSATRAFEYGCSMSTVPSHSGLQNRILTLFQLVLDEIPFYDLSCCPPWSTPIFSNLDIIRIFKGWGHYFQYLFIFLLSSCLASGINVVLQAIEKLQVAAVILEIHPLWR